MPKMIDPKTAREHILANYPNDPLLRSMALTLVDGLPMVEVKEVVHGRWEKRGKHDWGCTICKKGVPYSFTGFHYCPNCGADMRGTKDGKE